MRYLIILVAVLTGCYSPVETIQYREVKRGPILTLPLNEFLHRTFTDEAYEAVKDIEVVDGPCYFAYAMGSNWWSSVWGFISGAGIGNKVVIDISDFQNIDGISPGEALVHEMTHHLDACGRNGGKLFIDLEEFKNAYIECNKDNQYKGIVLYVENRANRLFTHVFGIGELSEHIGYTAEVISVQGCPNQLGWAYRRILRKYEGNKVN